ncbi:MAG: aldolase [Verrucomicrobiota bacterium]
MKSYRLNRLFNAKSGHCFDVAVDHGFFNENAFLNGIENMDTTVKTLVEADPDAIQLSVGQAPKLQAIPGKQKPALALRSDVANVYGTALTNELFSKIIEQPVEQAIRLDASCIVVNLFQIPEHAEVAAQCIDNILKLKPLCDAACMPLMIEPLVFAPNEGKGGYRVNGDIEKIVPLVRQAVELGADIIKADPCDHPNEYHRVVETAGSIPVLVRGGGKVSNRVILERTEALMAQGVRGIVYGRNIIQHENPKGMTQALMRLVHDRISVDEALTLIEASPSSRSLDAKL